MINYSAAYLSVNEWKVMVINRGEVRQGGTWACLIDVLMVKNENHISTEGVLFLRQIGVLVIKTKSK